MNALKTLVASAVLALAAPAFAGTVIPQLTFETIGDMTNLSQAGNNPYAGLGIGFSGNAFGIRSARDAGGSGNFFRDPMNLGALAMFNDSPTQENVLTLTVAEGFADFFSIEYAGKLGASGRAAVFDVQGNLLGMEEFKAPAGSCPSSTDDLCVWDITKFEFSGVAYSIKLFGSTANYFFDNIQLGQPGSTVPEPSTFALGFAALAALGLSRRRSTR
ncbi:PEP-CTERM sorting domain-containing protein [Paucibacter sp. DJ2R-2]|uniref:PEP-CTERM sorting domain-containing protein n=1 Tax=Paucibacter sp. DJ2R-2 TaxID=2893558 RepID=UPI0021E4C25C|nr:PEP-CTERM sorting domain-containing protein [Paucibacter sp. DJ2R-2]MCV2421841.1 PEP-CTERM sorting domain-containing protein [Paucibacter sp. DJ4R-1]MCV2439542.1 PEP-CTERM sorting domain-containing protein [Paucibacter sp. DJ2R-2]